MNWLLRLLWLFWGKQMVVREAKRRALAAYLRALRATRLSVIALLAAFVVLQLMILSGIGALVTGFFLWDHEFKAKIEILFWIFAGTFTVPAVLLCFLMSEYLWFRLSGARKLMDDLTSR